VIREGISEYLEKQENMICIAAKSSVEHFLAVLNDETVPDVILMDIGLPGMSGISGMKLITEKYPLVSIIMFTVYNDSHKIFESLCAGASANDTRTGATSPTATAAMKISKTTPSRKIRS